MAQLNKLFNHYPPYLNSWWLFFSQTYFFCFWPCSAFALIVCLQCAPYKFIWHTYTHAHNIQFIYIAQHLLRSIVEQRRRRSSDMDRCFLFVLSMIGMFYSQESVFSPFGTLIWFIYIFFSIFPWQLVEQQHHHRTKTSHFTIECGKTL